MIFPDSLQATPPTLADDTAQQDEIVNQTLEIVGELRSVFKARNDLYKVIDSVTFLENAVNIPEAYKATAIEVRSPLPMHITDNITSALSINPPTYRIQAARVERRGSQQRRAA